MKLKPIITSLLEIDMYKLSMGQCIYHQFSGYKTTWTFKCRNKDENKRSYSIYLEAVNNVHNRLPEDD